MIEQQKIIIRSAGGKIVVIFLEKHLIDGRTTYIANGGAQEGTNIQLLTGVSRATAPLATYLLFEVLKVVTSMLNQYADHIERLENECNAELINVTAQRHVLDKSGNPQVVIYLNGSAVDFPPSA